ncbi:MULTISPECIES: site-specific integrase [Acinetobacter]|uniref:site-specific integrase n=1 Tax=Acinetobacter TaxID=469 RepID=UPI00211EDD21|nr:MULTISPECIES: site-specific integrase [Acinetobacter]WKT72884.1 site-specific integrase [Acinetobacter variabilis]
MKTNEQKKIGDVESTIAEWVSSVIQNVDALWQIPISQANTPSKINVDVNYLVCTLGISKNSASKYSKLTYSIINKMIEEEILLIPDGSYALAEINARRKLLNWYRGLSLENKKQLPIFGNKISLGKMPKEQCPITKYHLKFSTVKAAWNYIHQDLKEKGIVDANYKTVAERNHERQIFQGTSKETFKGHFNRLATLKLTNIIDFHKPSEAEPYIQIEQLFASQSKTVSSESAKENYQGACKEFIKFLSNLYGNTPLIIVETFDEHLLSKFRKYLEDKIINADISSSHAQTLLSAVRKSLKRLTQIQDIEYNFFNAVGFDVYRQTDVKKPFNQNERLQILEAIDKGITESRSILKPYRITGIGKNPLDQYGYRIKGLSTLNNARWIFENLLNCEPIFYNTAKTRIQKSFLKIIQDSGKKLDNIYREWGVISMIGIDVLLPYLLKLAQVTGINTESLLALDIDDFTLKHPATGRPCLRYWKERSDGKKDYHLDLIKAKITWLTPSQKESVKNIFDEVIRLTSNIRENITSDTVKNRLFIYQSNSKKSHQRVAPFLGLNGRNYKALGISITRFVNKYQLKGDQDRPLILTISRFRPTLVSELIKADVSMREIQVVLGHSSIQTTLSYIDSLDFNNISRAQLDKKLTEIHCSTLEAKPQENPKKIEVKNKDEPAVTFITPLAACRNIFDPPEFVKKLASYIQGTPCSQYNKCLRCDNVVLAVHHLPQIFAMQRDYKARLENTQIIDTPYGHILRENLELMNQITAPNLSNFSPLELENARIASEYIENTVLIDGVI